MKTINYLCSGCLEPKFSWCYKYTLKVVTPVDTHTQWFKETLITLLLWSWTVAIRELPWEAWGLALWPHMRHHASPLLEERKKQINLIYYFWPRERVPLFSALFSQISGCVSFRELAKPESGAYEWWSRLGLCSRVLPRPPPLFPGIWTHTCWGLTAIIHTQLR